MKKTALDFIINAGPWAITEAGFETIRAVAERENLRPEDFAQLEAVLTKYGSPMPDARYAQVRDGVAIIPVAGPLFPKANLMTEFSGATSVQCVVQDLARAETNPEIKATVLDFHTPGGIAKGIIEASGVIAALKKPCVAYVSGLCCSAGFPLAAAANGGIVVSPDAILGSLGVVLSLPPQRKDGSVEIVNSESPDKRPDIGTDEGRAVHQKLVNDLAKVFLATCADLRKVPVEQLHSTRGGVLVGQDAIDAKLADNPGSLEQVIADLGKARKTYSIPKSIGGKPPMDTQQLKAEHPDLYATVLEEGKKAGIEIGRTEGAKAERERIQAVQETAMPGHEKLIADLMFDGKTTGPEAALAVIKAEKAGNAEYLKNWRAEGEGAKVPAARSSGDGKPLEEDKPDDKTHAEAQAGWGTAFAKTKPA